MTTATRSPGYRLGGKCVLAPVLTAIRAYDPVKLLHVPGEAGKILAGHGWLITEKWEYADNAIYAAVERA